MQVEIHFWFIAIMKHFDGLVRLFACDFETLFCSTVDIAIRLESEKHVDGTASKGEL